MKNKLRKLLVHSFLGTFLRIVFYYSGYKEYRIIIFESAPYSYENLKENFIINLYHKISMKSTDNNSFSSNQTQTNINDNYYYSSYEFISKPILLIYKFIRNYNQFYILIFFIICDLIIAYILSNLKYKSQVVGIDLNLEKNKNLINKGKDEIGLNIGIFCLYLYNPVSITTCISFNLDVIYTLINLIFAYTANNIIISSLFAFISIIISPGYIFITVFYLLFLCLHNIKKFIKNIFIVLVLVLTYLNLCKDAKKSTKNLYNNYFWFKDIRPNFGLLWVLLPSTFLKNQNYTLDMVLIYQITLSLAVLLIVYKLKNENYFYKRSLVYILIFYINHIFDRYPCENHQIVILCILLQHYEIIKVKILNLGVYCAFASYSLIVCRGFPYTHRRSGSSNYLFYQNLTYLISQIMIVMFSLTGINEYRLNCKKGKDEKNEKEDNDDENEEKEEEENKENEVNNLNNNEHLKKD